MTLVIKFILSLFHVFFSRSSIEYLMHIIKNHLLLYISMRRTPMKISGWRGVLHYIYDFPLSNRRGAPVKPEKPDWCGNQCEIRIGLFGPEFERKTYLPRK